MLRENRSLQSLNIESNFISSTGLMAVLKAVRENATLTELRVDNQVSIPSPGSLIQLTPTEFLPGQLIGQQGAQHSLHLL